MLVQIDGIQRLAAQLQALAERRVAQAPGGSGGDAGQQSPPAEAAATSMSTAASILRWTAAELGRLSDGERQAVLRLPFDLASRISSRAAARTIKLLAQV